MWYNVENFRENEEKMMKKRIVSFVLVLTMLGLFLPSGTGSINVFADGDFIITNGVLID